MIGVFAGWTPKAQDLANAQENEERNRQQMGFVWHANDLNYVNGNTPTGLGDAKVSVDPQLSSLWDHSQREELAYLVWVARHLAAIPGHKSLIWVSSDNVLADFSDKARDFEKGNKGTDPFALRAREALNDAHVSIYPLDVSQLEAGGVGAAVQHANVQVNRTSPDAQFPAILLDKEDQQAVNMTQRDATPGRLASQMQQDTHPIQGEFRELAESTGGRAVRRGSDIAGELNNIVNDGGATYQISSLSPTAC